MVKDCVLWLRNHQRYPFPEQILPFPIMAFIAIMKANPVVLHLMCFLIFLVPSSGLGVLCFQFFSVVKASSVLICKYVILIAHFV